MIQNYFLCFAKKESIVSDFIPNGKSVQEGINPNSLIPTKDLSTLDNRRLKNAVRYGGDKPIILEIMKCAI